MRTNHQNSDQAGRGFALIAVMLMMSVMLALISAYSVVTKIELTTNKLSSDSLHGFHAAEAGLNLRAEQIRQVFIGYNRPTGSPPTGPSECVGSDQGSGDFACQEFAIGNQKAVTYLTEDPTNPLVITVPLGERYQNLNAQEYRYTVVSKGIGSKGQVEAILELRFKSRLVPLFQFAAFYNKDLEILPGPYMNLAGPVHTNGDLYLDTNNNLEIEGQITSAGSLFRGRKNDSSCKSNPIEVKDPVAFAALVPACSSRVELAESDLTSWNGMIQIDVPIVTVPEPEDLDPTPGKVYWDKADIRLVLSLDNSNNPSSSYSSTGVEIRDLTNAVDTTLTSALDNAASCPGNVSGKAVGFSSSFYNNREGAPIRMLEVDMRALFDCVHTQQLFGMGKNLADTSEGGLVLHMSVDGPNSAAAQSLYGVRVRNGAELQATVGGAATVVGVTVVSDQAVYSWGDYNSVNKIPAAFLADGYNALSNAWSDIPNSWGDRVPSDTTVYAAILAGTDVTGGAEGPAGQDSGVYNGGLENYPRFHEQWAKSPKKTYYYLGSFVSLGTPRHSTGAWKYGSPQYTAPNREWGYDTDFNDASNLPPITPRFVYLRQQLFLREFEQ